MDDARAGQIIGSQFRLERLLASGGMGSVYLAEQVGVERPVAIKLMHAQLTAGMPDAIERFRREAKLAAQLNHPHVVQIYLFGQTDDGEFYLAMEYVDGRSLEDVLKDWGSLPEARVLRIAAQVCDALGHAHHVGLVHRDLKPANIMICERHGNRDYVKVLDFGIAKHAGPSAHKLTKTDVIVGTPTYMAPEHARGQPTDARTDLYSLGCVLYQLLGGAPPFESDSPTDLIVRHVTELPQPLRQRFPDIVIQPRVEAIVDKCLQKDPAQRYQSAAELKADIQRALDERPSAQRAPFSEPNATQVLPSHRPSAPQSAEHPAQRPTRQPLPSGPENAPATRDWGPQAPWAKGEAPVPQAAHEARAQPASHASTELQRWRNLALGFAALFGVGILGGVYALFTRGSGNTSGIIQVGQGVQIGANVLLGAGKTPPNQQLWKAFDLLRDAQHDCVENYYDRIPVEGPEAKRYYVSCNTSHLPRAKDAVSALDEQGPLPAALERLTEACEICREADVYYETGAFESDQGAQGRALHASLSALASSYLPLADRAEAWVYRTIAERNRKAMAEHAAGSVGYRFRALVVAGYATLAAEDRTQLVAARQQLESAIQHMNASLNESQASAKGALQGVIDMGRQLLTETLTVERLVDANTRLPNAGKGRDSDLDWRLLVEPKPTPLVEARREQGSWYEPLVNITSTLEELEQHGLLR